MHAVEGYSIINETLEGSLMMFRSIVLKHEDLLMHSRWRSDFVETIFTEEFNQ